MRATDTVSYDDQARESKRQAERRTSIRYAKGVKREKFPICGYKEGRLTCNRRKGHQGSHGVIF